MNRNKRTGKPVDLFTNYKETNKYLRLWFTSTNSFSPSMYVNHVAFSNYSSEKKTLFKKGVFIQVKDKGQDVKAIIIAVGSHNKMESLEPVLEKLAEDEVQTSDVLDRVEAYQHMEDDSDDDCNYMPAAKASLMESCSFTKEKRPRETSLVLQKEKLKIDQLRQAFRTVSPQPAPMAENLQSKPKTEDAQSVYSKLMLAEMRVQTTILKKLLSVAEESKEAITSLCDNEHLENLPKKNFAFIGFDGSNHNSSQLNVLNPSVFVRDYLRKKYTKLQLSTKILCPKGPSKRQPFSEAEVEEMKAMLLSWYGQTYKWSLVVASVNQFLREIKTGAQ